MVELIAIRYGTAIFQLAKEKDAISLLKEEILMIKESFEEKDFREILSHPKIGTEQKIALLEDALTGKISNDLLGLLVLVITKGRQAYISNILEEVLTMIDAYEGKVKAYISSAETLSEGQKERIITMLHDQTNQTVIPIYEVDESLIAGLVIRMGDRIMDNSIKGQMHTLSKRLLKTKMNLI